MCQRVSPEPTHDKKTTTRLTNGVMLVKSNQISCELGLVVMSVGVFYKGSLHSSFVENKNCKEWSK